jgi:MFS family permease
LVALYFLLFFEFLFPQTRFDELFSSAEEVRQGIIACLWAFGAVAIGRHLVAGKSVRHWRIASFDAPRGTMIWMFWGCFFLGFLHMLIAVNFDPFELVQNFLAPRFDQPWGRGQLGDWRAMLTETGNLLYLVPPLAGVILARRKHYSKTQEFLVSLGVLFTFFYGFSTGTRNIIGSYLITFLVSFFYASGAKLTRSVVVSCALAAGLFLAAAFYGIEFRNVGLGNYLKGARESGEEARTLHVDYNIFVVSRLTSIFPEQRPFIGMDAPLWLLARPLAGQT